MTAATRIAAATTAATTNRFVTSTNMKVGAYTVANAAAADGFARLVTVTHTEVGGGVDTLGTITVTGTDLLGAVISEVITPVASSTATGKVPFKTVTGVVGAGWVIGTGNDTIVVGHDAGAIVAQGAGLLEAIVVNTTASGTVVASQPSGTIASLKASVAEGPYPYGAPWVGWLRVALGAASDVTVVHGDSLPSSYAMA